MKLLSFLESKNNLIIGTNTVSNVKLENIIGIPSEEKSNKDITKKFDLKLSNYPIDTSIAFMKLIDK